MFLPLEVNPEKRRPVEYLFVCSSLMIKDIRYSTNSFDIFVKMQPRFENTNESTPVQTDELRKTIVPLFLFAENQTVGQKKTKRELQCVSLISAYLL